MAHIAELALFTEDVPRLTSFYELVLGRPPDSSSESHASFSLGEAVLFIHIAGAESPPGVPNRDHVALALNQEDAAQRARAAGVEVVGPSDFYWGRSAYLEDPDGRMIELQEGG